MLITIAELIVICLIVDALFRRFRTPGLIGMLLVGVLLGPHVANLLDPKLLALSSDLRMLALIVILLRAGLELSREVLHRVGRSALMLAVLPALFEACLITLISPPLLGLTYLEGAILGTILSAVSPAVVIAMMVSFIERGLGTKKNIPELLLSACPLNDVFVIVVYSALLGLYTGEQINLAWELASIPLSIVFGVGVGLAVGFLLCVVFRSFEPRATKKVLILLCASLVFVRFEAIMQEALMFPALLAILASGFMILEKDESSAHKISARLVKLWVLAEILLFTMVGAQVDVALILKTGGVGVLLIASGLLARALGSYFCLLGSPLNKAERFFVVIAYFPKATVQAAIGGMPLLAMIAAGLDPAPGNIILAVSVLSIVLTAPFGAWAIEFFGKRILEQSSEPDEEALHAIVESQAELDGL